MSGSTWSRRSIERDRARFDANSRARFEAACRIPDLRRALQWICDGNWYWLHKIDVKESDLVLLGYVNEHHEITDAGRAIIGGIS